METEQVLRNPWEARTHLGLFSIMEVVRNAPGLSHKGYVPHQELTCVKSSPYLLHMCVAQSQIERLAYRSATSLRLASVSPSM